jgi:hypothetical protein
MSEPVPMPSNLLGGVAVVGGFPSSRPDRRGTPALRWEGLHVYRRRAKRPTASVVPDADSPFLWRVRLRDGSLTDAMSLARARAYAWDAGGRP